METRWLYTTSENFSALREASKETCIIPIGCVEKHGLHLPLGTDILQASQIVWKASQIETVCVFPDFVFGDISEDAPNMPAGSITIPFEMEMLLLKQLCEQMARNGFRKIILYNGHGGNRPWLHVFLQELNKTSQSYTVHVINIRCDVMNRIAKARAYHRFTEEDKQLVEEFRGKKIRDGHAGYSETAYIMGTEPDSVHMDRLGIISGESLGLSEKYKELGIQIRDAGWGMDFPNWIDSDEPIGCNERIGKQAIKLESERVANLIRGIKNKES